MSDVFAARFPGNCASCGDRFPAGASIRRVGGTYIHADCSDLLDPSPIEGPACTVCWLRYPEGECDRD